MDDNSSTVTCIQSAKKVKIKSATCYSTSYMRWNHGQKRFIISEVGADWHELMIPQHTMRTSIAHASEQLDPWLAASRHITATISHIRPSPRDQPNSRKKMHDFTAEFFKCAKFHGKFTERV